VDVSFTKFGSIKATVLDNTGADEVVDTIADDAKKSLTTRFIFRISGTTTANMASLLDPYFEMFAKTDFTNVSNMKAHTPSTEYLFQVLAYNAPETESVALTDALAAYRSLTAARDDCANSSSGWSQYSCDDNVLNAICSKINAVCCKYN
jgi:hypothetical protein